ncbi:phosphatase [Paludibacterium yongneupense]|uniref:phosphatase n=1 Tax=Paludibacterium yongneupense TaxID=400061 RepID=UPI000404C437|nr:phosphatase [Paludibacterium yongneupense]
MPYQVDTHTHTLASTHAFSTLHDNIAAARRKGILLFATTDHGPDLDDAPHPWHFTNSMLIPRIVNGVAILRGIEANIRDEAGTIDCDDRMWGCLDIVLAGFHDQVFEPQDSVVNTRALINTIRSGRVHVITHPGNPRYPIDIPAVAAAAAECNVALEINNSSFHYSRVGSAPNCLAIARAVRDAGGLVSLGSDAHIAFGIGEFEQSLQILDAADFPAERVLNRSPRALLDFLESHGKPHIAELAGL